MTDQTANTIDEPAHDAVVVSNTPIQFDVTAAAIAEMQIKADGLSIDGPDDKDGFTAMYNFRQVVRRQRLALEKKAEELKAPHKAYLKRVDAAADTLVDSMKAIESNLQLQEKAYKDEVERLAHERAMFLQNRTEGRVNDLRRLGFQWCDSDDTYTLFGFDEEDILMEINFDDIKNFSDEEYEPTRLGAYMSWEHLQERIKERNRLAEEERIRKENEAKAEAERLAKIAADQKAEADRLAAAAKQLEEAEERARQIELKARLVIRTPQLVALGYVEEEFRFNHPTAALTKQWIQDLTDQEFDELLPTLADRHRQWVEAQQREELSRRISLLIEKAGFKKIDGTYQMQDVFELTEEAIGALTDKEFETMIDRSCAINDELSAKQVEAEEQAKKQADEARQARLKPDRKHLRIYFETAGELVHPPITQPESEALIAEFTEELTLLVNKYLDRIDTL